ncbi:MAG: bifunctional 2-polyprenyl-6-hydroxyphenol methylase/3-demethylubiquinol 3-O-methyltransferase UbiG [Acetobacteraceae bacterium]|nr:bifunctional 2-polyprenyl-6-hydroxyphenol methylase/3-demethylubiquinol 3-O-methyltransferase UbiG [Acetobacteraceae bacterium]MBV8523458.1 bifunctional 2-polyprenyl-6-hydroxyphenol methylase/3-demethylubiquinol 3-O-methyltransferase UbiG [Acetobacteraceae bacterium]MBV8592598.1 bifunctional 2-polyprenyl-6-hydroxyphenol methylase/3-demethylubiquinol 3-O-methyltransferase UbiG [Acetobacteraceae bacterium]
MQPSIPGPNPVRQDGRSTARSGESARRQGPAPVYGSRGTSGSPSVPAAEVARFDALAGQWWDPYGPMRPLHLMNPVRLGWIIRRIGRDARVLDVGCGAGLLAEALAQRGCEVLGIDAAPETIAAARVHAASLPGLRLTYRVAAPEDLLVERIKFPVITALEVIEHVPDPDAFIASLAGLLQPGGKLFLSTLNRTARSFLLAKIGAEYVLRFLPVGTHDWRQFIKPEELAAMLRRAGMRPADMTGLVFNPLTGRWRESRDMTVNYMVAAER